MDASARPLGASGGTTATTNGHGPKASASQGLSADEIALYDRQIRLWGAQAQERIRSASVLLVSLRALGTEIAKNLTLAGIRSLTIIDDEPVSEDDLGAQYFLRDTDIGKPRAQAALPRIQELNPRVHVNAGGSLELLLVQDQTYFMQFSCVIACDHDFMTLCSLDSASHLAERPFYAAGIHGFYGFIFADLGQHEFVVEREKSNKPTAIGRESTTRSVINVATKTGSNSKPVEVVRKKETYCALILSNTSPLPSDVLENRRKLRSVPPLLSGLRALFEFERTYGRHPEASHADLEAFTSLFSIKSGELQLPPPEGHKNADFLRSFVASIDAEILPTAAFVGGRLSEDIINVLGQREQPIQNFALFDGDALEGKIYSLYSPEPVIDPNMIVGGGPAVVPEMGNVFMPSDMGTMGLIPPEMAAVMGVQMDMATGMPLGAAIPNGGVPGFMPNGAPNYPAVFQGNHIVPINGGMTLATHNSGAAVAQQDALAAEAMQQGGAGGGTEERMPSFAERAETAAGDSSNGAANEGA